MRLLRLFAGVVLSWLLLVWSPARAAEIWGDLSLRGQVRDGDQSRETEAPMDFYGNAGVSGLWYRSRVETYFRVGHDFARGETKSDFYAGYAEVPGAIAGVDLIGGRQFISEGPGGVFVVDGGKVRIDRGWPVAFTLYGGRPRYFEPVFSEQKDEILWGGNVRTTRWKNGVLGIGYQQLERDGKVLQQLVSVTATQAFPQLPGLPKLYSSVAYDADRQNLDLANLGVDFFLKQPKLFLNFGATYYRPQDSGDFTIDPVRREDQIFELFSSSDMLQFRGGLRYPLSKTVSTYADYSYQRYDGATGEVQDGHVANVGLVWLPGGDGLEVVRLEYYVSDSGGGNVNGGAAYYGNEVYERLFFNAKIDVAYYDKDTNQSDVPVASRLGLGYLLLPGLLGEVIFEANRNARFDEDFRFGFAVSYDFSHTVECPRCTRGAS